MRTRSWRRYKLETIVKKRLKKFNSEKNNWWAYVTPNGDKIKNPIWSDEIGSEDAHLYRLNVSSDNYGTKYSPNRKCSYYRDKKKYKDSFGTREADKILFLKILKENGIK
jgi:hypothetical protein